MTRASLRRAAAGAALAAFAALLAPAAAPAHSGISISGGTIYFRTSELGSESTVLVSRAADGSIDISDPTGHGGVSPGPCVPITETRARCSSQGIVRVLVAVGPEADSATSELDLATSLQGGPGVDLLKGGPASDELLGGSGNDRAAGGEGNDSLNGGLGADDLDGGPGNDSIRSSDGEVDSVSCGAGADTVVADPGDVLLDAAACESVQRVAPSALLPAGPGNDLAAPVLTRLRVAGAPLWLTRARRFARISWTLSEGALTSFRLRRAWQGHRVGNRCRRGPARSAKRRCVGFKAIGGVFDRSGKPGRNTTRVALVYRGRLFAPGRYRLEARATDPAGHRSRLRRFGFRVLKPTQRR